ncbi:MAG: sigma-70 family RNA polymerase sigma factor [Candidatus Magasanikbacteria bacterium]|jgi:RNA polymerase sigma-70 factor (ECF subfamily)|nr:sigma-70 family RNA polymerase sigma factor [Candidatus Magasanikbacteria bacterium]
MDVISSLKIHCDSAQGYIFVTDASSRVLYTNPAIEQRTGFVPAEVIGKRPGDLWGGMMPRPFYQKLWTTLSHTEQVYTDTVTNKKKNNEMYQEHMYILPIRKEDHPTYFFAFQPIGLNQKEKIQYEKKINTILHTNNPTFLFETILAAVQTSVNSDDIVIPYNSSVISCIEDLLITPTAEHYKQRGMDNTMIRLAQQNHEAFATLYTKYRRTVFVYFMKHLSDAALAEDNTQETFLKAFSHLATFVPTNATYQTYLLRIAHNVLVNQYRKQSLARLDLFDENVFVSTDIYEAWYTQEYVQQALAQIPEIQRNIITWYYMHGYSIREIAERLGKSENAVKLQLSRARKAIKQFLK